MGPSTSDWNAALGFSRNLVLTSLQHVVADSFVNLAAVVVQVEPSRFIRTRAGDDVELSTICLADEGRSNFSVCLWRSCCRWITRIRIGDVIALCNVRINTFQDKLQASTLSDSSMFVLGLPVPPVNGDLPRRCRQLHQWMRARLPQLLLLSKLAPKEDDSSIRLSGESVASPSESVVFTSLHALSLARANGDFHGEADLEIIELACGSPFLVDSLVYAGCSNCHSHLSNAAYCRRCFGSPRARPLYNDMYVLLRTDDTRIRCVAKHDVLCKILGGIDAGRVVDRRERQAFEDVLDLLDALNSDGNSPFQVSVRAVVQLDCNKIVFSRSFELLDFEV